MSGTQQAFSFDVCANRHTGSPESRKANPTREAKRESHTLILAALAERKMTAKELAVLFGKTLNAISGRCSELRLEMKLIRKTGVRREGSAELELMPSDRDLEIAELQSAYDWSKEKKEL